MKLNRRFRSWLSHLLIGFVCRMIKGRRVAWWSDLNGTPIHRADGVVTSARVTRYPDGAISGATFTLTVPGRSKFDVRRFSLAELAYNRELGLVFFQD